MQTRSLKTLLTIDQTGSFAKAAAQLNMTLSAVSMQMKVLEQELSADLFDRSFRPPKLTPLGRSVCQDAQKVLDAEETLLNRCSNDKGLSGNYRVGFVATASVRLLPRFLNQSAKLAPNAQFDVETGLSETLEEKVLSGQLDAAVVTASSNIERRLKYHELQQERLVYAAPKFCSGRKPLSLFDALPFIHFSSNSGIGKLIARHVAPWMPGQNNRIMLDNVEAIMECVNNGIGFTLLPEPDVMRCLGNDSTVLDDEETGLSRSLVLVSLKTRNELQAKQLAALFGGNELVLSAH